MMTLFDLKDVTGLFYYGLVVSLIFLPYD